MSIELLAAIWFGIICFEIALYILLDGADLGLGVLSLLPQKENERSLIMHTVGPIWDANETWLVIAAGTLFGAFPMAYGIILNALYIPVMALLFGLILRAVSFEFHAFSKNKRPWSLLFGIGSLLAILGQGAALGGVLGGIPIIDRHFAGGAFDWATPLTFFITIGIMMSYIVVGYAYLVKKTSHQMKHESFRGVLISAGITFVALFAATIILSGTNYLFFTRWTMEPSRSILYGIALLIGALSLALVYSAIRRRHEAYLHSICMGIFAFAMLGMIVGVYPYLIPPSLSIFTAAASRATLTFMLWGIGPLLPIVLFYNFYLYRIFKHDIREKRSETYGH